MFGSAHFFRIGTPAHWQHQDSDDRWPERGPSQAGNEIEHIRWLCIGDHADHELKELVPHKDGKDMGDLMAHGDHLDSPVEKGSSE